MIRWDWADFVSGLLIGLVAGPVLAYIVAGLIVEMEEP